MKKWKIAAVWMAAALAAAGCGSKQGEQTAPQQTAPAIQVQEVQSGSQHDPTNTDVVIVMDKSGSMRGADRERIAIEAAKMFIDMEKTGGANVAVVEFSTEVKSDGLLSMDSQDAKAYLKSVLDNIEYVNLAHTDTGAALQKAVSILEASDTDNKKAIILFTDGRTQITTGSRTLEESMADRDGAVDIAAKSGYPIYAVGLNYNHDVDEEELTRMSVLTGGRTLITSDVRELPDFFNSIFQDLGNIDEIPVGEFTANGDYQSVEFEIANDNILEANVVMLSGMQLQDVRLYDPDGAQVDLNGDKFVFSSSSKYAVVKMLTPRSGNWRIEVKGISGDQIKISLLYNYDINMITTFSQGEAYKGDVIRIASYLNTQGRRINDEKFYQQMTGVAAVVCKDTGVERTVELIPSADGMAGEFTVEEIADHTVTVHLEGQGLYRDSEPVAISVINRPVQELKAIGSLDLKPGEEGTLDLSEYFVDPDGEPLTYTLSQIKTDQDKKGNQENPVLDIGVEDGLLSYQALEKGSVQIELTVSDESGSQLTKTIEAEVNTFFGRYRFPILAAAALLAAILIGVAVARAMRYAMGYLLISVDNRSVSQLGQINSQSFTLANGISARSVGKSFTLAKVLQKFSGSYGAVTFDQGKLQELDMVLGRVRQAAGGVKFAPTKDKKKMQVSIKHPGVYFSDITGTSQSNRKKMVISCAMTNSSTIYIKIKTSEDGNESVIVRITYSMNTV